MIQKVLKDDGSSDGVYLAALAEAAEVAALSADDGLGFLGGQTLVPQRDRHADHARGDAGEVLRTPRLRPT